MIKMLLILYEIENYASVKRHNDFYCDKFLDGVFLFRKLLTIPKGSTVLTKVASIRYLASQSDLLVH